MKKFILFSFLSLSTLVGIQAVGLVHSAQAAFDEFTEGWEAGWEAGWQSVAGEFSNASNAPNPPTPVNNTYKEGFTWGVRAGVQEVMRRGYGR